MRASSNGVRRPGNTQLYYGHPTNDTNRRQVTVPLHDESRVGTLHNIAENLKTNDFDAFWDPTSNP